MARWRTILAGAALLLLAGCSLFSQRPEAPERARAMPPGGREVTATLGRWVRVEKAARSLTVFEDAAPIRTYPVVLGADPVGTKLFEGDNRTPEGEYHIVAKFPHPRWSRFLLLDYPAEMNRLLYQSVRSNGLLPKRRGAVPGIGGEVGIHGTVSDAINRRGDDWTRGCVSLLNRDMEELYFLVDVGTRVVIEK